MQINLFKNIKNYLIKLRDGFYSFLDKRRLPFHKKVTLFDIGKVFVMGLVSGSLTTRASSIAFKIFLAVFPAILFVFTLIPYIPIDNFQDILLSFFKDLMPNEAYLTVKDTILDVATHKQGGLLSVGFITAMYFATNGISGIIAAFNATTLTLDTRTWYRQQLISMILVLVMTILITTAIAVTFFSGMFINYLLEIEVLKVNFTYYLLFVAKWLTIGALYYFAIAFMYYYAPARRQNWKFFSFGSMVATILTIFISVGFSYYVNNFGQYNKLYGSIGTLIVVLMWMYFNSLILLIGFELNISINNAENNKSMLS